ncbi:MAG: Nicotinate phosphoribosyltransferase [Candidatus Ozemobacter sibiricus]|uniref:Nicotinate phosphoribosyltransferase n=1 Tax=Candidatus Ozemobacter sibiricus TaxID=2268124 RepID=A0A367ZUC3_9BACT|nr:MAG: Nicotinate phosphoribosyltransferase [Candidatus Ozemobacter sibiricus]
MNQLSELYRPSLSLLTDLYQLTMAYGYWKTGTREKEAVFNLFFRKNPFQGGFTIAAGLSYVLDYLSNFRFVDDDIAYLAGLLGNDGKPLFEPGFLDHLRHLSLTCDVDAVPEGTVVFPHEPLVRVQGPLVQCQILETALLNMINFQSLIATKAARVCLSAQGEPVLEFGLRRAQGIDGALAASRAAYIGGAAATSNVLAGKLFGIPVRGTHAHSWVMSFDTEEESFRQYAAALPNNCVFLVDTYDTLEGVRTAVRVGTWLREQGHEMVGIRLDSGDLAWLSREARKILDAGGFPKAAILASNDLDENIIGSLKQQGAAIAVWGVGTKLVTGHEQAALGGVYKLVAIRRPGQPWDYKVKLSEQAIKISTPGLLQVRRFTDGNECLGDLIYDTGLGVPPEPVMVDPMDPTRRKKIPAGATGEDLLIPVVRQGKVVYRPPPIGEIRERARLQLQRFHGGVKRFVNPHPYPVGLEQKLHELKTRLILKARGFSE